MTELDNQRIGDAIYRLMIDTPQIYFAINHLGSCGGVQTTASHNPAAYLGIKILNERGTGAEPPWVADLERFAARALADFRLAAGLVESDAPLLRRERQGLAAILAGIRIDLRMRLGRSGRG